MRRGRRERKIRAILTAAGELAPRCPMALALRIFGPEGLRRVPRDAIGGADSALVVYGGRHVILLAEQQTEGAERAAVAYQLGEWALAGDKLGGQARTAAARALAVRLLTITARNYERTHYSP